MSKRIFSQKKDPLPITENGRTPSCYYHKQPITHFCTKKKCTLPLCGECLSIHKKEHISNKEIAMEGIEEFEKARGDALGAFEERRKQIFQVQEKFKARVEQYKEEIVAVVDKILQNFSQECLVTDGNLQILQQIQQRTKQIRGGSLKELIRYYEDIFGAQHFRKLYKMYYGDYLSNFKYELNIHKLEEIVKNGLINTAIRQTNTNNEISSPSILEADEFQVITPEGPSLPSGKSIESFTPVIHRPQKLPIREKDNDSQSQISTYKLMKTKVKKNEEKGVIVNIYTDTGCGRENVSGLTSKQGSQASRSKSKRKKGLSLAKSHQNLPLETRKSFNKSVSEQQQSIQSQSQEHDRRSNWRQFINMGNPQPSEPVAIKQIISPLHDDRQLGQVLNPREMRQLILKKKQVSKLQNQKQLRSHRSSATITPASSLQN